MWQNKSEAFLQNFPSSGRDDCKRSIKRAALPLQRCRRAEWWSCNAKCTTRPDIWCRQTHGRVWVSLPSSRLTCCCCYLAAVLWWRIAGGSERFLLPAPSPSYQRLPSHLTRPAEARPLIISAGEQREWQITLQALTHCSHCVASDPFFVSVGIAADEDSWPVLLGRGVMW